MSFILPLLFIVCFSGTMMFITKRNFVELVPLSLMMSVLTIFISGFFNNMLIGYYICLVVALLFPIFVFISIANKKIRYSILNQLFTPGFIVFIVIYIFVYFLNLNRGFTVWDEISHWGPMVKETLRLNKFYSVAESTLSVHKDYPPAATIIEYMWCKLSGGYKEAYLYRSLQMFSLSLFLPSLTNFKWKSSVNSYVKLILAFILIISINITIAVGEANFYKTIYIDCLLGLMLSYCLSVIIFEKHITAFGIFRLSLSLSFLLLTKQMGIVFFLLILGSFIVNYALSYRNEIKAQFGKLLTKKYLLIFALIFLAIVVVPYMFSHLWNVNVEISNIERQFNISSIKISEIFGIFKGTSGEAYQRSAMFNFVNSILFAQFTSKPVSLGYWQLMLVGLFIFYLIGYYGKDHFRKNQIIGLATITFFGALAYAFSLLLLYVFAFGDYEGPRLASLARYINTYWYAVFALAIMLLIYIEGQKEQSEKNASFKTLALVVLFIWVLMLNAGDLSNFKPAIKYSSTTSICADDAGIIKEKTTITDSIFIVSQHSDGFITYTMHYLIMPQKSNMSHYSLGEPYSKDDVWTKNISKEEWVDLLISNEYQYVYLRNIDDQFIQKYGAIFKSKLQISEKSLYKVNMTVNSTVELQFVE